jgi:diadenosine tetraphosphatase ApaH/serine/threonine PP2A family protein phosphatase
MRKLKGKNVKLNHGLEQTMAEIEAIDPEKRDFVTNEINTWLQSLISHYVLDDGKLVVAHAGLREELQGRGSGYVRSFALYGETTGEIDQFGLPVRYEWANEYRGEAMVVYGHTPVLEAEWLNNTIDIDTGCVFGGKLTALRYPERELVSVKAAKVYCEPIKPLNVITSGNSIQQQEDILDIEDVTGKRFISTKIHGQITIREDQSIAALEIMSRFAVNPKLMPWSAKAQELLKQQYAPVGVAANQGLRAAVNCLQQAQSRGIDVSNLLTRYQQRAELPEKYIKAYRQYCWSVNSINDLKLAPFHILATEGQAHTDKPHSWHLE